MISLTDVHRTVILQNGQPLPILRGITLDVAPGEHLAIIGQSGTGKSTLLNIIGMLDLPDSGSYVFDGIDVTTLSESQRAHRRGHDVGFVFQQFNLFSARTALANVAAPLLYSPDTQDLWRRRERALEMLERVGLAERANAKPQTLSGGEQQRVAIARALIRRPRVILADEPTGALDRSTGALVIDLLEEIAAETQAALVVITHDPAVARRADRVVEIADGVLHPPRERDVVAALGACIDPGEDA